MASCYSADGSNTGQGLSPSAVPAFSSFRVSGVLSSRELQRDVGLSEAKLASQALDFALPWLVEYTLFRARFRLVFWRAGQESRCNWLYLHQDGWGTRMKVALPHPHQSWLGTGGWGLGFFLVSSCWSLASRYFYSRLDWLTNSLVWFQLHVGILQPFTPVSTLNILIVSE